MTTTSSTPFTQPAQPWNSRIAKDGYVFGTEPNEWLRRHASAWKQDFYDGVAAIFVQFADPALRARLFENMVRSLKPEGYSQLGRVHAQAT